MDGPEHWRYALGYKRFILQLPGDSVDRQWEAPKCPALRIAAKFVDLIAGDPPVLACCDAYDLSLEISLLFESLHQFR